MQLHEQCRPKSWGEVVGQPKAIAAIDRLRSRGLAGRAFWISGKSGVGKTTIAKLLAAEVADDWGTLEIDGGQVTAEVLEALERDCQRRPFGKGTCLIINEAHGLRAPTIRRLLVILEALPAWVTVIMTTTVDGQESLFEDQIDAHPLLSRCVELPLAARDLAKPFAERAKAMAEAHGLDGQPLDAYIRLVNNRKANLRAVFQDIEGGVMVAK